MNGYSKLLLRISAIFALIGAFIGSHMAGAGGPELRTVHAHILAVGWLSLFAWAVYYKVFTPANKTLAALHVYSAIIGSIGLTSGMWLYYTRPFGIGGGFTTVFFIVGGTIMLISFAIFLVLTFLKTEDEV
ncbi:hypothetical protein [Lentibacillus sediminis]|uniref:hypothetical protein n=1 Tax=Lentibacillus sediminis TaxID=1940529 RepID=UPI000C1C1001|nr:hypothetical protein [Lentibacillus sediminis]